MLLVENEREAETRAMVVKCSANVKYLKIYFFVSFFFLLTCDMYSKDSLGNESATVDTIKLKMFVFQPSGKFPTFRSAV